MDADHDLPAHAEDLDAAFAEAVANAGPRDVAEPHPAADRPLRDVMPADTGLDVLATIAEPREAGVHDRSRVVLNLTALADVEEHELPAGDLTVFAAGAPSVAATVEHRELEPVAPTVSAALQETVPAPAHDDQRAGGEASVHAAVQQPHDAAAPQRPQAAEQKGVPSRAWIGLIAAVSLAAIAGAVIVLTMLVPNTRGRDSASVDRALARAVDSGSDATGSEHQPAAVDQRQHAAVPALAPVPAWRATEEWTGGRKKSVAYELSAERPVRLWMRQATPVLVVRCLAGTLDTFVVTGSASAIEPGRTDHTVQITVDDGQPETQHWTDSADHDGLFAPNGAAVFSRVASGHTLRFTFTPHNAPPAEAVFAVHGAGTLAGPLGIHCR